MLAGLIRWWRGWRAAAAVERTAEGRALRRVVNDGCMYEALLGGRCYGCIGPSGPCLSCRALRDLRRWRRNARILVERVPRARAL